MINKKIYARLLTLIILFTSCQFSKGVKKDLATGLTTTYNGLTIENIYLTDSLSNAPSKNNIIKLGNPVSILAIGVDYFTEENGKVFPACSIILKDKNGKEIINQSDAFAALINGTSKESSTELRAILNTGNPMVAGESYQLDVVFFDRKKKENEIKANIILLAK